MQHEIEMFKANTPIHQTQTKNIPLYKSVRLEKPMIIGYMSVDVSREYHHNLSQLKYLTSILEGRLNLDLNHNIDKAVKRTTDDNDEKISLLLKYLLDQKHCLTSLVNEDIIFVTYRRSLISVMCNIYNRTPVSIVASLFNNCIYLYLLESPQDISKKQSSKELSKFCAWGYKFEQYMLSDTPKSKPNIDKPVLENEEFSLYFYTQLGSHRLFYGAQIDGMLATNDTNRQDFNESKDANTNLMFLKRNIFVELKTQKEIYNRNQEITFKKYKLLRCWCQCFLAGLEGLLVGYRNQDGIIGRVKWFDTPAIVRFCQNTWSPQTTLDFLNTFLNFVKESFITMKTKLGSNYDCKVPLTLKFDINEQHKFFFRKSDEEAHTILPNWYIHNVQETGRKAFALKDYISEG